MAKERSELRVRRSRTDYPAGVIADGGATADRYTVVTYGGFEIGGWLRETTVYPYVGMSGAPFHPQGVCQHGEAQARPVSSWNQRSGCGRVIPFEGLPFDCRAVVLRDLAQETEEGS